MLNTDIPFHVSNENEYEQALSIVDELMRKGEKNVTHEESLTIQTLALAIQAYERKIFKRS